MDDTDLTAEEQAALESQRNDADTEIEEKLEHPETPAEGATEGEAAEGAETPAVEKTVSHAALVDERERRKESERRYAELERRSEARFTALLEKFGQPAAQPETQAAIPTVEQDPVGHIVGTMRQQGATLEQVNQFIASQRAQSEQQQADAALQARARAMEAEFRAEVPDYNAAMDHLAGLRHRQLMTQGVRDPAERNAMIAQEARYIASRAFNEGKNPAEVLYQLAGVSGYAKPADPPPAAPDAAAQIQKIERGQQHARSLGNVRGTGPSPWSAQKILTMSPAEFDKLMQNPPDEVRKLFGP